MRIALLASILVCLATRTADAGRSFFGWLYGTEVMPERGVELQTWVWETNGKYANDAKETSLWWGPLVGITDCLELALPMEMVWLAGDGMATNFTFKRFGIEARYRLAPSDPVEAPPVVPLLRLGVKRDIGQRSTVIVEADAVVSYDIGAVQALVDLGFVGNLKSSDQNWEFRPGGGVSVAVTPDLRLGAEFYGEINFESASNSWAAVGPNLSWTHGRFWFSGAFGIGLYHVKTAPRFMWGIAF